MYERNSLPGGVPHSLAFGRWLTFSMRRKSLLVGLAVLWMLGLLGAIGGCGRSSGPQRVVVTGTVTYNGQPIPNGEIRFVPTGQTKGPISGASILEGKYRADGLGGVIVGTHRVEIRAFRADKSVPPDPHGEYPRQQYLPKKFNDQSTMEVTIPPDKGTQTFNFDLKD
ncbi:MAG: hypothetical protein NZ602_04795 [Thermoguttaceae bacterium]|nr:hypothetical protein [Thermoguttaceae bacterium]MDW8037323.1 hypothetical protein [Thermoguttaceae bacterium]